MIMSHPLQKLGFLFWEFLMKSLKKWSKEGGLKIKTGQLLKGGSQHINVTQ